MRRAMSPPWTMRRCRSSSTTAGPPPALGQRQAIIREILANARRGRHRHSCHHHARSAAAGLEPLSAEAAGRKATTLAPKALDPDYNGLLARLKSAFGSSSALRVVWIGDGVDRGGAKEFATGLTALANGNASVEAVMPEAAQLPLALATPAIDGGRIEITALRAVSGEPLAARVRALAGNGRDLADATLIFAAGSSQAKAALELPVGCAQSPAVDNGAMPPPPVRRPLAPQIRPAIGCPRGRPLPLSPPSLARLGPMPNSPNPPMRAR
jgi:hypothetical protein